MRRIVIGAAAAAALAWAQGAQADHHTAEAQQKKAEKKADQAEQKAGRAEKKADQAEKKADQMGTGSGSQSGMSSTAPGAASPGTDSATASQDARHEQDKKHPLFEGKKNFDMDGKVSKASSSEITIERKDGLPPATLKLGTGTKVEVDGKQASATQLQAGQDVKASFNLRGETPEAVEVKAKKAQSDDRKEMQEQRRENQQERAKDQQKAR